MQDLSAHIMDIAQNSIRARATRVEVQVEERAASDALVMTVRDNGTGMDEDTARRATDPFFTSRTTRKVGLGLSLLKQRAEAAGGEFTLRSTPGEGTTVRAAFRRSHVDCPPVGDVAGTIVLLAVANPGVDIRSRYSTDRGTRSFSSARARALPGEVPLDDPAIVAALREMIGGNIREIQHDK